MSDADPSVSALAKKDPAAVVNTDPTSADKASSQTYGPTPGTGSNQAPNQSSDQALNQTCDPRPGKEPDQKCYVSPDKTLYGTRPLTVSLIIKPIVNSAPAVESPGPGIKIQLEEVMNEIADPNSIAPTPAINVEAEVPLVEREHVDGVTNTNEDESSKAKDSSPAGSKPSDTLDTTVGDLQDNASSSPRIKMSGKMSIGEILVAKHGSLIFEDDDWYFCKFCNINFGTKNHYYMHTRGIMHATHVENWHEEKTFKKLPITIGTPYSKAVQSEKKCEQKQEREKSELKADVETRDGKTEAEKVQDEKGEDGKIPMPKEKNSHIDPTKSNEADMVKQETDLKENERGTEMAKAGKTDCGKEDKEALELIITVENDDDDDDDVIFLASHLFCDVCNVTATCEDNFVSHLEGAKHLKKVTQLRLPSHIHHWDWEAVQKWFKNYVMDKEGDIMKISKNIMSRRPHLIDELKGTRDPVLGLDYIIEYQPFYPGAYNYHCHLCDTEIQEKQIICHAQGLRHNKRYLMFFDLLSRDKLVIIMTTGSNMNKEVKEIARRIVSSQPAYMPQLMVEVPQELKQKWRMEGRKLIQKEGLTWIFVDAPKDTPKRKLLTFRELMDKENAVKKLLFNINTGREWNSSDKVISMKKRRSPSPSPSSSSSSGSRSSSKRKDAHHEDRGKHHERSHGQCREWSQERNHDFDPHMQPRKWSCERTTESIGSAEKGNDVRVIKSRATVRAERQKQWTAGRIHDGRSHDEEYLHDNDNRERHRDSREFPQCRDWPRDRARGRSPDISGLPVKRKRARSSSPDGGSSSSRAKKDWETQMRKLREKEELEEIEHEKREKLECLRQEEDKRRKEELIRRNRDARMAYRAVDPYAVRKDLYPRDQLRDPLQDPFGDRLPNPHRDPLQDTLRGPLQDPRKGRLRDPLCGPYRDPLFEQLRGPLWHSKRSPCNVESLHNPLASRDLLAVRNPQLATGVCDRITERDSYVSDRGIYAPGEGFVTRDSQKPHGCLTGNVSGSNVCHLEFRSHELPTRDLLTHDTCGPQEPTKFDGYTTHKPTGYDQRDTTIADVYKTIDSMKQKRHYHAMADLPRHIVDQYNTHKPFESSEELLSPHNQDSRTVNSRRDLPGYSVPDSIQDYCDSKLRESVYNRDSDTRSRQYTDQFSRGDSMEFADLRENQALETDLRWDVMKAETPQDKYESHSYAAVGKVTEASNAIENYLNEFKHSSNPQTEIVSTSAVSGLTTQADMAGAEQQILTTLTRAIKDKTGQDSPSAEMVAKALTKALAKFSEKDGGNADLQKKVMKLAQKASRIDNLTARKPSPVGDEFERRWRERLQPQQALASQSSLSTGHIPGMEQYTDAPTSTEKAAVMLTVKQQQALAYYASCRTARSDLTSLNPILTQKQQQSLSYYASAALRSGAVTATTSVAPTAEQRRQTLLPEQPQAHSYYASATGTTTATATLSTEQQALLAYYRQKAKTGGTDDSQGDIYQHLKM